MIVAFDTYYYGGFSYTVAGVFEAWNSDKVKYFVCSRRAGIDAEYKPGELYKRELPCIMQCLEKLNVDNITSIVVDGFVWVVDDEGNKVPGLGKRLQDAILEKFDRHITVIGVAKNPYHTEIPGCKEVLRGKSAKPLYITCTEDYFIEHYVVEIKLMFGESRIPDILKSIDTKTRSYCEDVEEDTSTVDRLIKENNKKNKQNTLGEIASEIGAFEQWAADVKGRGFEYT
jgi:deoxyinosine 3'endonuclease (endonuclease V)